MAIYLLDCNHLSPALRTTSPIRNRIEQSRLSGHRFVTCHPVLCELESGIQLTPRPDRTRHQLNELLRHVRLWPLERKTTEHYGSIFNELRRAGRVLSQVDMILAAMARQHSLTLLTSDRDFEALADLKVENWAV